MDLEGACTGTSRIVVSILLAVVIGAAFTKIINAVVEAIMKAKPHPEQGFPSCLGIMRLVRTYGSERVEAASRRGNDIGADTSPEGMRNWAYAPSLASNWANDPAARARRK